MQFRRMLYNSVPWLILQTLGTPALSLEATYCKVKRTVETCSPPDCHKSALNDFSQYVKSQEKCGVQPRNSPYILQASTQNPFKGTVVLVHGLAVNPSHMSHIAKELQQQGYSVVAPILFGHGGTDDFLTHATLSEWENDVRFAGDIAAKLGTPLYAVGHSTGGVMAGLAASQRPGFYKAVVGPDPALNLMGEDGWKIQNACKGSHFWRFPSEVPRFIRNFHWPWSIAKACTSKRDSEFIRLKEDFRIEQLIKRFCSSKLTPPDYNSEFTMAGLCALNKATQKIAQKERIQRLPPSLAILSQDEQVFGYIGKHQIQATFNNRPHKVVESKSPVHGLMVGDCSPGFKSDMQEIKDWLAKHR